MNWLAHIFISKNSIEYQLGNLLADPLKGRPWQGASALTQEGFAMHKTIDAFTDANAIVSKSKARLGKKGYLKGVIIDVAYDHLLAKNWNHYSKINLDAFMGCFYENAIQEVKDYPEGPRRFVTGITEARVLSRYTTLANLEFVFQRMDKRLSSRILAKERATDYWPRLQTEMDALQEDFAIYFPQLIAHFKTQVAGDLGQHWLKI